LVEFHVVDWSHGVYLLSDDDSRFHRNPTLSSLSLLVVESH